MGYYDSYIESEEFLAHHGILGQKWGVRRYQNKDGTLTEAGKKKAAKGAQGRAELLREGEAKARNKRIKGAIAGATAEVIQPIATGVGAGLITQNPFAGIGTGIGTAIGSKISGHPTSKIINQIYKEKANAISNEYMLLANDIMKEYSNVKVKDISDGADVDSKAHAAAKKAGLDQGDNYKVYRDAEAGDKKSQEIVKEWENKSIKEKVSNAKKTGKYDMEFLEKGLDLDWETEEPLKGKALDDAYEKYLRSK